MLAADAFFVERIDRRLLAAPRSVNDPLALCLPV